MTISSISSTSSLLQQLEANGLSADKAKLVGNDLAAAEKTTALATGATSTVSAASVRAALDSRIAADVSSGKLSKSDAATVTKTLDDIDAQSGGSGITSQAAPAAAPAQSTGTASAGSGGGGHGGGGGGGSSKTELSETVTVVGSTETTTITYTDGTSATTTTVATEADKVKYGKPDAATPSAQAASDYLSTIEPGSLINQSA